MENLNTNMSIKFIQLTLNADERIAIWQVPEQNDFCIRIITNETALSHQIREEWAAHHDSIAALCPWVVCLDYLNKMQACEEAMQNSNANGFIHSKPHVQIYTNSMDTLLDWIENNKLENEDLCSALLKQLIELHYIEMVDENFNPAGIRNSV